MGSPAGNPINSATLEGSDNFREDENETRSQPETVAEATNPSPDCEPKGTPLICQAYQRARRAQFAGNPGGYLREVRKSGPYFLSRYLGVRYIGVQLAMVESG